MQPYDACRLMCLNLFSFVMQPFTDDAELNYMELYKVSYEMQLMADDLVDLEIEAIERIIQKIKTDPQPEEVKSVELALWEQIKDVASSGRRTGNGFTGLGDMLAAIGIKYDSDRALEVTKFVMNTKFKAELDATIDMAEKYGSFKGWDKDSEFELIASNELVGKNSFYNFIAENFEEQANRMFTFGRRNVSWSTVAPTGSVSILADVTSGLEPLFMPYYTRRKKVNPNDVGIRVDFTDQNGDNWMEYPILHEKFKIWYDTTPSNWWNNHGGFKVELEDCNKEQLEKSFKESPWYGSTANDIDWKKRVELQAVIQKYTTHSISSTINLPNDVTKEEVSEIYLHSYKKGLKGVTIYRDGCRTGVLVSSTEQQKDEFISKDAPKRPKALDCKVHQTVYEGNKWLVVVGLLNEKPYEVFCVPNHYDLPYGTLEGVLTKKEKGTYSLNIKMDSIYSIENIVEKMTDEQEAITRLISTSLRHGADIKFIVEQLQKTNGGITAFSNSISRVLKLYIPEGEASTLKFEDCDRDDCKVVFEEGCVSCKECGKSKC
jgi:ribonucleoside-diphosphate reductase alpha chain